MPDPSGRPVRADARANEDKLLAAAALAFTRDGAGATLKQIAKDAGVGIATLYRRFPTREQLVDATYRYETARLSARTSALLGELPADRALRAWMSQVLDYIATKHGMADTLKTLLQDDERLGSQTREQLTGAIEEFRVAGIGQGVIRPDVPSADILMSLAGVTLVAGAAPQRAQAERLLDLLMDGLTRPTGGTGLVRLRNGSERV
ncbi:TetR/AcrR family transcriptional regulator [Streptomyces sp. NE06-03E]|uniref:TetR/AcrR family transcriptional regulator n=1 Tax=Streptomyces sp. gb1(2016) TaxID=1828321 RepID=A0A652LAR0_9ACTN|nr:MULTISPECIES: TetR/AcrR family transcriptional regulator [unclassified Streptomyces]WSS65669.1 TetR/AcrR family transcriptional regulator [Streptomyces sp. NBC_01177]WSS72659.1 TetR/AcrR family transcriptional regulator [Streptomyces sp. NBC_01175]WSS79697.1 TetR/AcrR family transcriptional regulator [Streptomyces sp. NBC_01174]MDX3057187.1 TetR/AcrR family transcriptional regulator [Streptomyces sp. NE06-03E]MDX3427384.1 TetR/AcrR family transcriptional regulator [Streptomyces sp. ME01-18a